MDLKQKYGKRYTATPLEPYQQMMDSLGINKKFWLIKKEEEKQGSQFDDTMSP